MKGKAYRTISILEIVIAIAVVFICLYDLMHGKGVSNAALPAIALILGGFCAFRRLIDKKKSD